MRKYRITLWSKNKEIASNCFYMGTLRGAKATATREIQKFAAIHGDGQYKAYIIMDTPSQSYESTVEHREMQLQEWAAEQRNHERMEA